MEYSYSLDAVGNLSRAEETFTAFRPSYLPIIFKNGHPSPLLITPAAALTPTTRVIDYSYDDLYRLAAADYSTGEYFHYTYDPRGNRLTQSTLSGTTNYSYDNANRLTQVDGQSYTWDDNGNLLDDGQRTYSYDTANRLISVIEGVTTTQFSYNGDGDRISQTVGGVTTDYALDPIGLAQVLVATTGGQSEFYVPGLGQYTNNSWQYFVADRLGSVRQIVDPTGQLLLAQSFDPFGNVLEQVGAGQSIFGYTGEQTDPTGLVFLRVRYYSPYVNRFISPDTIIPDPTQSQSWNRYLYVGNNPLVYTDPSGHCFGFLAGGDTLACIAIAKVAVEAALLVGTIYLVNSEPFQQATTDAGQELRDVLETFPGRAPDIPPLPGTTLQEEITPCHQDVGADNRVPAFELPPFSLDTPPYFEPMTPGFSTDPIPLPTTLTLELGKDWRLVSVHTERSTRRGGRQGGVSIQEIYENIKTGERIIVHTVLNDKGQVVDGPHTRPFYKPRDGDISNGN